MVAPEPLTPRARVRDNQFTVLTADPVLLASLGGPRVVHELSSLAWASVLSLDLAFGWERRTASSGNESNVRTPLRSYVAMWAIIWLQPLVAAWGLVLAGLVVLRSRWPRTGATVQAVVVALSTLGLALYAASEDDYRRNGISRWDAYDAKGLTVVAVVVGVCAAIGLFVAATQDRRRLGGVALLASSVAGALMFAAFLANSLN